MTEASKEVSVFISDMISDIWIVTYEPYFEPVKL